LRIEERLTVTAESPAPAALSLFETPGTVTVVRIEEGAAAMGGVSEVLARQAGVYVRRLGGPGAASTLSLRGAGANQVVVLLDGLRLEGAQGTGVDLSLLPLEELERIEILRGPASARFGSGAMGGVVNLVTHRARAATRARFALLYGSYDERTVSLRAGRALGGVNVAFAVESRRYGGGFPFRNDNGTEHDTSDDFDDRRENSWSRGESLLLTLDGRMGAATRWRALFESFAGRRGVPGLITFPSPHATQRDQRQLLGLWLERTLGASLPATVELSTHYRRSRFAFDDPLGEQTGVPVASRQLDETAGGRLSLELLPWEALHLSLALESEAETLRDPESALRRRTTWASAISGEWRSPGERLRLTPVLRSDRGPGLETRTSPRLGVAWRVAGPLHLTANAGASFRYPSFSELYLRAGAIEGNPELRPERGRGVDLGVFLDHPAVRLRATLFRNDSEDLIQYILVSGFRYKPFNIGRARSQGVEVELTVRRPAPWLLQVNYTYNDARDRSGEPNTDGKQIPGRPRHDLSARLERSVGEWTPYMEYRWLDGNYLTRANTKWLPARRLVDAGLQRRLGDAWRLGVAVRNLLDNRVVDVRGFPLPPRTICFTVSYDFAEDTP
jgi:outer membrane cobalamin receptor